MEVEDVEPVKEVGSGDNSNDGDGKTDVIAQTYSKGQNET